MILYSFHHLSHPWSYWTFEYLLHLPRNHRNLHPRILTWKLFVRLNKQYFVRKKEAKTNVPNYCYFYKFQEKTSTLNSYYIPGPPIAPNGEPIPPNALNPPKAPNGDIIPPPKGIDKASFTAWCAAAAACAWAAWGLLWWLLVRLEWCLFNNE